MNRITTALVMVDGRCRLTKDQLLSTLVDFSILSATSVVGVGGRGADLHMLVG